MLKLKQLYKNISTEYITNTKEFLKNHQNTVIDTVTIGQLYGGLRDVITLATETSLLDSNNGIKFWENSIEDVQAKQPKTWLNNTQPLVETIFWLLLTGTIPTEEETKELATELHKRLQLPNYIYNIIQAFPKTTHPMIIFTSALAALEQESQFNKAYNSGVPKNTLWEHALEDALNIIAQMPLLVSYIYNYLYNNGNNPTPDTTLDWAGNFAKLMGDTDTASNSLLKEFFRVYMVIHSDHEGANASANTAHVVGSTLASPYGALAGGMHSLSGPLHGMATQNALDWIINMLNQAKAQNTTVTHQFTTNYINNTIANKQVVPGYGHAVLRKTDPRFTAQMNFAKQNNLTSELLETVWSVYSVAPEILGSIGKIKNPYPNVDAHSGALLHYFGFVDSQFYTVLFGASRTLGIMAQQIWDRTFMHPLHRPKSVTSLWVKNYINNNKKTGE